MVSIEDFKQEHDLKCVCICMWKSTLATVWKWMEGEETGQGARWDLSSKTGPWKWRLWPMENVECGNWWGVWRRQRVESGMNSSFLALMAMWTVVPFLELYVWEEKLVLCEGWRVPFGGELEFPEGYANGDIQQVVWCVSLAWERGQAWQYIRPVSSRFFWLCYLFLRGECSFPAFRSASSKLPFSYSRDMLPKLKYPLNGVALSLGTWWLLPPACWNRARPCISKRNKLGSLASDGCWVH